MFILFNAFLLIATIAGGSVPLWNPGWSERSLKYLLAFSGSFLLSITLLHLVPETVEVSGHKAGLLILAGFFLQQVIQRFTHGVEHGHIHVGDGHHHVNITPVFIGLAFHAFSEGLPLGGLYADTAVVPSLYLAIALHKLPEAMLITSLVYLGSNNRRKALSSLLLFSMITPVAALLSYYLGLHYQVIATLIHWCIPVIAGAFIHIATTIFFESGTRSHDMNWKKWLFILTGIALGILTLTGDAH